MKINTGPLASSIPVQGRVSGVPVPGGVSSDPKVAALEAKVAALEAQVALLLSVLTVENNGQRATLKAETVTIQGIKDVKLDAAMHVKLRAGVNIIGEAGSDASIKSSKLKLEAAAVAELIGGASCVMSAAGTAQVKGAIVKLADGGKPVTRVGDPVAGNVVVGGSTKVMA